ncbi:hypothetical protein H8356DRAFT_1327425 [Neocallimastix lanati (nom. inval.)]|nr:hypothetical protein H8356DRAFT_1327425 [Neocallimastix sp. JGI-2020a]
MSPLYVNMGLLLTAIPVRPKKLQYRSILRDPHWKAEPLIRHLLVIPEELDTVILSDKAYAMGFLKWKNREDLMMTGVDPETFDMISQRLNE